MASRIIRIALVILTAFLALTAFAGGIGLGAELNAPPVQLLEGSPFRNFVIPGLSLFVVVGGLALAASHLLLRRHRFAPVVALLSGLGIIIFEVVEIMVIGSDPGVARTLQVFYLALGLVIVILSLAYWLAKPAWRPQAEQAQSS